MTVRSLVRPEHASEVEEGEWFFCDLSGCDVVYFTRDGRTLEKDALKVRVGLKEKDAPRPVCYCFGHSVESLREEIRRTGRCTAAASIKERIEAGECRCEVLNPRGTCCLGDVNKVVKEAVASLRVPRPEEDIAFGQGERTQMRVSKEGLTLTGALVAGVAASACCLGPLVLAILGIGGAASALALEPYRPYLLVLTAAFLGFAFHRTYRRPARACGPGEACAMPKANRAGKILLWLVAVVVILAATFPYYSRYLF